jgi:hypothetical protein
MNTQDAVLHMSGTRRDLPQQRKHPTPALYDRAGQAQRIWAAAQPKA